MRGQYRRVDLIFDRVVLGYGRDRRRAHRGVVEAGQHEHGGVRPWLQHDDLGRSRWPVDVSMT